MAGDNGGCDRGNVFAIRPPRAQLIDHLGLVKRLDRLRELRPDLADQVEAIAGDLVIASLGIAEQLASDTPDPAALAATARRIQGLTDRVLAHSHGLADEVLKLP